MNDPFVVGQAEFWAKALIRQPDKDPQERITAMFRRAFSRNPDETELARWTKMARNLVTMHEGGANRSSTPGDIMASLDVWKDLAHSMFNAKEFIYVP